MLKILALLIFIHLRIAMTKADSYLNIIFVNKSNIWECMSLIAMAGGLHNTNSRIKQCRTWTGLSPQEQVLFLYVEWVPLWASLPVEEGERKGPEYIC